MKKYIFPILFLTCSFVKVIAQEADFLKYIDHREQPVNLKAMVDTATTNTLKVTIDDFQDYTNDYVDFYYNVYLEVSYQTTDISKPVLLEDFELNATVNIEGTDNSSGNSETFTDTVQLKIGPKKNHNRAMYHFGKNNIYAPFNLHDLQKVEYIIDMDDIDTSQGALSSIEVTLRVEYNRYFTTFSFIDPKFHHHEQNIASNELKRNEAAITWNQVSKPSSYEVEVVHIPYDSSITGSLEVDFTKNATRFSTDKNFIPLTLIYPPGYLVVRGRSVRSILNSDSTGVLNKQEYTKWNISDKANISLTDNSLLLIKDSADAELNRLNWQYTANHANESKKKEVITFFDGSQRSRQQNTVLNDFSGSTDFNVLDTSLKPISNRSTVISQESYYNLNGQQVISMLPSPIIDAKNITFQKGLNFYDSTSVANEADTFKLRKATYDALSSNFAPKFNKLSKGAVQYYSDSNRLIGIDNKANFIADAGGYPYTRVEYLKDGSGRIKAEYAIGADRANDDTKGTRYAYAKPTTSELESLFGTNVGRADFYKKNVVIDPNGVMNIAYINNKGQTVASSIAGIPEGRSKMDTIIDSFRTFTEDLLLTGADQFYVESKSYELTYPIFVTASSTYLFEYGFDIEPYRACSNVDVCFDCRYELIFQIIDDNNEIVLEAIDDNIEFVHDSCLSDSYLLDTITYAKAGSNGIVIGNKISVELSAQKQYSIIKKLRLKTNFLEEDAQFYLDSSSCNFKEYSYFENYELNNAGFENCVTEYSDEFDYLDPCEAIREGLKADFLWPDGAFVTGADSSDNYPKFIFDRIVEVAGCRDLSNFTLPAFRSLIIGEIGIEDIDLTFANYSEDLIDFLIHFHPTYCQLAVCEQYYTSESLLFDRLLEKSNTATEFTIMAQNEGFVPIGVDYFFNNSDSLLNFQNGTQNPENSDLILTYYDPIMQFFYKDSLIYNYENKKFFGDIEQLHYSSYLNEVIRDCDFERSIDDSLFYRDYFQKHSSGCKKDSIGLNNLAKFFSAKQGVSNLTGDIRWDNYSSLYQSAKSSLMGDILSSIVCFPKTIIDTIYEPGGNPEDPSSINSIDTTFKDEHCVNSGTYFNPAYGLDSANRYFNEYVHFVGTGGALEGVLGKGVSIESFLDTLQKDAEKMSVLIGKDVYALLHANGCIRSWDSVEFVNTVDSSLLVCDIFNYLDTLKNDSLNTFLTCNPYEINFSSAIAPYRIYFTDSLGNKIFNCTSVIKESYNCLDFKLAHHDFIAIFDSAAVPMVDSSFIISMNDTQQVRYKNWMNDRMGLNLSFRDYYLFSKSCVSDSSLTVFGDSVFWEGNSLVKEIREASLILSDSGYYLTKMTKDSLFTMLDSTIKDFGSRNDLFATVDYLGFGEKSISNNQYNLYLGENLVGRYNNFLDTLNWVYASIFDSLKTMPPINANGENFCTRINLPNPTVIASNIIIDRAYRYSGGTVWVRLLNASDSSFYNDFYYQFEPFNCFYELDSKIIFDSLELKRIVPVFDQEIMHYARSIYTYKNIDFEILVNTTKPIAEAINLGRIELGDFEGVSGFPQTEVCEDRKYEDAKIKARVKYKKYLEGIKDTFKLNYSNFCLNRDSIKSLTNRRLKVTYTSAEKQFTLYYYDQADNLAMTVPPSGVDINYNYTSDTALKIVNYRSNETDSEVLPVHEKRTIYKYNAANQIIREVTPNGDTSLFWYDKAGRLVYSQNAEQKLTHKYSYTLYDDQSRIKESGVVHMPEFDNQSWEDIHAVIILGALGSYTVNLDSLLDINLRTEVTRIFYDKKLTTAFPDGFVQENLRSRVATQAYYLNFEIDSVDESWDYATHYSYDATGNVKTLINDYYQNGSINNLYHRFKRIDYAFDVISGNVLQVYYQMGREDAFYHRYEYDAENRITKVETSTDGIIWDEDANYDYYLHGPLARTVLGEHKVQGIDYAYTLDGWLKSVNGDHQNADMGNDLEKENSYAADAFGYAINYNQNDYQSIGNQNAILIASNTGINHSDLYNGNISSIVSHNQERTIGREYKYDQLNRIKTMTEKAIDLDPDSLKWENGILSDGNSSMYYYDKNGNLTSLQRVDGVTQNIMDDFTYNYISGTDKLSSVNDTVSATAFTNDIDNQVTGNYKYDQIGNLVSDSAEGICDIRWYTNGKVKRIVRDHPTRLRADLYFEYDALGNRVKKTVSFEEDHKMYLRSTYYVRDAQGNIMATYEERDCDYYEADDSTGVFYYQYGNTFGYYTQEAINQTDTATVLDYLIDTTFFKNEELCEQAYLNLPQVPHIRDSIIDKLIDTAYFNLYSGARGNVISLKGAAYANYLYTNDTTHFVNLVNYENETYIQYLIENDEFDEFYEAIDSLYTAAYGKDGNAIDFYNRDKYVVDRYSDDFSNLGKLLTLNLNKYNTLRIAQADHSRAISDLESWLIIAESYLGSQSNSGVLHDQIIKLNALLLMVDFTASEINKAFSKVEVEHFYNTDGWLTPVFSNMLNSMLYHSHLIDSLSVEADSLNNYQLTDGVDWLEVADGEFIAFHLHKTFDNVFGPSVIEAMEGYFSGKNIKTSDLFFYSPTSLIIYVQQALNEHWQTETEIHDAIYALSDTTKTALYLTQDLAHLTNYFKLNHPEQTLYQNYYYDSLDRALSGLAHLTPTDYANLLVNNLGVSFDSLEGCSPHTIYMLAQQYNIYGSSRLGTMDAKQRRKDGDNRYSRKLGAKNYELSDHLGNVVATISDKKLHPKELTTPGQPTLDSTLGYQAEVTGRYDYYPFGMEIQSRSGDFNSVDYTTDKHEIIFKGFWKKCASYKHWSPPQYNNMLLECSTEQDVYGEDYVSSLRVGVDSLAQDANGVTHPRSQFTFRLNPVLSEFLPNLDSASCYRIEFKFTKTMGRTISGQLGGDTLNRFFSFTELTGADGAAYTAAVNTNDKTVTFELSGGDMQYVASFNGNINFIMNFGVASSTQYYAVIDVEEIKVTKVTKNTNVPVALRNGDAYSYGFNGMERGDATKGSGNHYNTTWRQYDPRLGRWFSLDPKRAVMPWESPYSFSNNSPIAGNDPDGDICVPCIQFVAGFTLDVLEQFAEGYFLDDITSFDGLYDNWSLWQSARSGAASTVSIGGLAGRIATSPMLKRVTSEFLESIVDMVQSAVNSYYKEGQIDVYDLIMEAVLGPAARKISGTLPKVNLKSTKVVENQLDRQLRVSSPNNASDLSKVNSLQRELDGLNKLNSMTTEQIIPSVSKTIYKTAVKSSPLYKKKSSKSNNSSSASTTPSNKPNTTSKSKRRMGPRNRMVF